MALDISNVSPSRPTPATARAADDPEGPRQPPPVVRQEDEDRQDSGGKTDPVDPARIADAVERANRATESLATDNRTLRFQVDEGTGNVVMQVLDGNSDKVVRQIPPEEFLEVAARLRELKSLLLDTVA